MKLFLKISAITIFLIVIGVVIFIYTLDINKYKPVLEQTVSNQTGREFTIHGDIGISPSLIPVITLNGLNLANAPWASTDSMLNAERVEARLSLLPLLSGTVHINNFILHNTRINLEKNPDGIWNWELDVLTSDAGAPPPLSEQSAPLPPIFIDEIDIRNAYISYIDQQTDTSTAFNITEFTSSVSGLDSPLHITVIAEYDNLPLTISGTVGPLDTLLADNNYLIDLAGSFDAVEFEARGNIERPMQLQGADISFSGRLRTLADLNELATSELPDIRPVTVNGKITFDDLDRISINEFRAQLGASDISGDIVLQLAESTPRLTAGLSSDTMDLSPFMVEEKEETEFLFSRDELDLAGLSWINADISLSIAQLELPKINLANTELTVKLQNGHLQSSTTTTVAGGKLSASIGLQSRDNAVMLNTDISGSNIMLEQLPHSQRQWFTGGPVELQIKGSGHGNSVAGIIGDFTGNVLIKVGEATMPNSSVDLVGADILMSVYNRFNPFANNEEFSLLECAVINFYVNNGLIIVDRQIAMQTSKMNMVGSGEINLITESLNLGMKPYAREGLGLNIGAITGVARIGGTLANPRPEIDPKGTLTAGVTAGAAIATGGLSLLAQGLFSRVSNDQMPCATALGAAPVINQETPGTSASPAEQAPQEGGLIDNVRNRFRGLLGN